MSTGLKTRRVKVTAPVIKSRAAAEAALAEIRALTIQRNSAALARETELQALDERFQGEIEAANAEIEARAEQLRVWAEANPGEFGQRRSVEFTHGTLGWRTGNPTLKTRTGFTWDRVLERLREGGKAWARFIRTKEEVDKASLLAERDALGEDGLKAVGVRVVQEEPFFVEPKLEETPDNRLKEAA